MGTRIIPVEEFLKVETVTTYYATSGSGAGVTGGLDPTSVTAWQDGTGRTFVGGAKDPVDTFDAEITFSSQAEQDAIIPIGTVDIRVTDDDPGANNLDPLDALTIEFLDASGTVLQTLTGTGIQPANSFGGGGMGHWVADEDLQVISLGSTAIPGNGDTLIAIGPLLSGFSAGDTLTVLDNSQTGRLDLFCFDRGTLIETEEGDVAVEDLRVGDRVVTLDHGPQPIRWIGSRQLDRETLEANEKLRPIRIRAGALGDGVPARDLVVSRQHRILVRSKVAKRMFGAEVLIPAHKLIPLEGVTVAQDRDTVEYFHFLFDDHQIVLSNGMPTESLFTGPQALKAVSPEGREEILTLFPELAAPTYAPKPARHIPDKGRRIANLVARHKANSQPLL